MPIAIIPARSGSKRIKNKNIKSINGKPMISWVIKILQLSKLFNDIIVSTDSKNIANIALKNGASVPFLRSKTISGPKTPTSIVIHDVLKKIKKNKNNNYICCVYPTAILLQISDIRKGYSKINKSNLDYVFSATQHEKSVIRSFILKGNNTKQLVPKSQNFRSQDLENTFYDAGQFYWGKRNVWLKRKNFFNSKSSIIHIPSYRSQDIDYPNDLKLASEKFILHKEKKLNL